MNPEHGIAAIAGFVAGWVACGLMLLAEFDDDSIFKAILKAPGRVLRSVWDLLSDPLRTKEDIR